MARQRAGVPAVHISVGCYEIANSSKSEELVRWEAIYHHPYGHWR